MVSGVGMGEASMPVEFWGGDRSREETNCILS
jgi:hypothetical protein